MTLNINPIILIGIVAVFTVLFWVNIKRFRQLHIIKMNDTSLTCEELEEHARKIAIDHTVSKNLRYNNWPVLHMNENYDFISSIYKELNNSASSKNAVPPAAEWLLDNFYILDEQVKVVRKDISSETYLRLPVLKCGPLKGYARIYAIAAELVSHTGGQINDRIILNYLNAYQSHSTLSDREIWAMPAMIRIALIENIKNICEKLNLTIKEWQQADEVIDNVLKSDDINTLKFIRSTEAKLKSSQQISTSFIEHLSYRLRKSGRGYARLSGTFDDLLSKYGTSTSDMCQKEHSVQAAYSVSIGNCILSLKFLSSFDWSYIFDEISNVEKVLREDNSYRLMDPSTRSFYRQKLEDIALASRTTEIHVAKEAVRLSKSYEESSKDDYHERKRHVGYYLSGKGIDELEESINYRPALFRSLATVIKKHAAPLYLGSIIFPTILITYFLMHYSYKLSINNALTLSIFTGLIVMIPASEIVTSLVNWTLCNTTKPSTLPRLELKDGIGEENSTLVVIPALLPDEKRVNELISNLERHYLSNKEDNLYFALAGDFKDSHDEKVPLDQKIIDAGLNGIKRLNNKYKRDNGINIFYYFHRHRKFNQVQKKWMGWERKRGALVELNNLLTGAADTSYSIVSSPPDSMPKICYVLTLDADTILPIGSAKKLVGIMAHPLNKPVLDEKKKIVVDGYGLIQPHIGFEIESANKTLFSRIYTGQEGINPYACAISDIYQDVFGEGIFTGKGIYDLHVFQKVLEEAIPENRVLSHDLLEGSYIRTGLATDIELVDSFPASYASYAARMHRWTRGDWQLLPWLGKRLKDKNGNRVKNPLNAISIWKMIDNMRRSLTAPSILILIISGFSILPGSSLFWLGLALFFTFFPIITSIIDYVASLKMLKSRVKRHIPVISGIKASLYQMLLQFIFLPYQGYLVAEAVLTTLYRVFISKKNMLEWVTAADVEKEQKNTVLSFWNKMNITTPISLGLFAFAAILKPYSVVFTLPLLILWSSSPFIAFFISRIREDESYQLSEEDMKDLRIISRKTWRYFEEFINHKNNFLPPDNFQEDPPNGIAYRTSPTNIGLGLMSFLAARDLGYIGTNEMTERTSKTLSTIDKLEIWNNHLYNWYDTRTLRPLRPRYVSTVDSGNLICYLIAFRQGLYDYRKNPLIDRKYIQGIDDTAFLASIESGLDISRLDPADVLPSNDTGSLFTWKRTLEEMRSSISAHNNKKSPWLYKLQKMVSSLKEELDMFHPWIDVFLNASKVFANDTRTNQGIVLHSDIRDDYRKNIFLKDTSDGMDIHGKNSPMPDIGLEGMGANPAKGMGLSNRDILRLAEDAVSKIKITMGPLELAETYNKVLYEIECIMDDCKDKTSNGYQWLQSLHASIHKALGNLTAFNNKYENIIEKISSIIDKTTFTPLYDSKKQLFSIGYNLEENRLTNSYYDLLASEARQTSYLAVARGEVPPKHWSKLGRSITVVDFYRGLVSWTGTMFEYLMPLILMKNYKNTLLDETYSFVVRSQKKYGKHKRVPWGVSESGFCALDIDLNYQYKAVGVPWLGLKRGLVEDTVVSPYSTFLALLVDPRSAVENIKRLRREGLDGAYGFYEAVDYTADRLPFGSRKAVVKSYMVHHEGMSLLSLNNFLNRNIMQDRFHNDPLVRAGELLLQEKVPVDFTSAMENKEKVVPYKDMVYKGRVSLRKFTVPDFTLPKAHLLSNGSYCVMITDRGTGYSKNNLTAISRWREDITLDPSGMFFYIRNIEDNTLWSSAYEPINKKPDNYEVAFSADKARFKRIDGNIETITEITVTSEDNAEIRRLSLKNLGEKPVELEITSYFEVVMAPHSADVAHPAFSNLFVKTELVPEINTLLAVRRPRSESDKIYWLFNTVFIEGETMGSPEYETDRLAFIGRGHNISDPVALERAKPLSNSAGSVLDPIMSTRVRIRIQPKQIAKISLIVGVSKGRDTALAIAQKYSTPEAIESGFKLAQTRSQVEAGYLNISYKDLELYQDMISHILFLSPLRRNFSDSMKENSRGQSSLWPFGISGDLPIVTVALSKSLDTDIVYDALKAHEYWRLKGLKVDLVILNEEEGGYNNPLRSILMDIISSSHAHDIINKPGGVYLLNHNSMSNEDIVLIYSVSRLVLKGNQGSLSGQVKYASLYKDPVSDIEEKVEIIGSERNITKPSRSDNGLLSSGFNNVGNEYVIRLEKGEFTPMPWSNIISNPDFGFLVTESGSGYTWSENSRENKLTPWSNDPVSDTPGEIFYICHKESGEMWSLTPLPTRQNVDYTITHGFGYSAFEHESHGIRHSLVQIAAKDSSVKINFIKLVNTTGKKLSLTLTYYIRPVMGVTDQSTAMHIRTWQNEKGTLFFENPYNEEFHGRVAFMDVTESDRTVTGDRKEFFGTGKLPNPSGLLRNGLSGSLGAGFDPCAAMQVSIILEPNGEKEVVFLLGSGKNADDAYNLAVKYNNLDSAKRCFEDSRNFWKGKLETIQVETPDRSMNIMLNGWLLYQIISCRLWARSGFYQSGGAFGFRDQLQDCLALINTWPEIARKQILLHASHQFVEGDVQHWWHEPSGKGTRTKFSDDLLWLPYVTAEYIRVTNDFNILDEMVPYIEDEPLREFEDERYSSPRSSSLSGPLYEHCKKTIERSLQVGEHGIPLMGSGDWNDGMNTVGNGGKGESVWLGWFLYSVLNTFAPICQKKGEHQESRRYLEAAKAIVESIESNAWDGNWYRRAYFDNGQPLGSIENSECKIDSISQSWAIFSEGGNKDRAREAMHSLENYLIQRDEGLIKLLTPPFDEGDLEPGYIKSYIPGVRENGGQYTHAAAWVIIAFAKLGDGDKALELFDLINPINHTRTHMEVSKYKVEPYVMPADVYAIPPHVGRGGWTWYTGSASWYYKSGIEYILGFRKEGNSIIIDPCIPKKWKGYTINYNYGSSIYKIEVRNPQGVNRGVRKIVLDDKKINNSIPLVDDGKKHKVEIVMG
ncbi:MAG TPA: glucoamylase family protein [Pseudobacteroides sp.]|uniref:GH36-type glycosyl hydrolase domain-containing protein n=1 Tax=Pseudobacteroides sp. TaxID=1968840 RepID=UPI002F92BE4C